MPSAVLAARQTRGRWDAFRHLDAEDVELVRIADRSVLGCMSDMALHCECAISAAGDISRLAVPRLNGGLRCTIVGPLGNVYPIELAAVGQATRAV
jgi:hypothetical protein